MSGEADKRDRGILRRARANPLATVAVLLICLVFARQAVVAATEHDLLLGVAVIVTGYVAYRVARVWWTVENAAVATALARQDLFEERG